MKRKFLAATMIAFFMVSVSHAQAPGAHNPDITPTVTEKQIKEFGQGHAAIQSTIVLDFEGLGNNDPINDFYNGGTSGSGFSGTDYGVAFSTNALALISQLAGGSGNIMNLPSGVTGLYFLTGQPFMNVAAGFEIGFSFYYSAPFFSGSLSIYDGLNGTGNLLASVNLPTTPTDPNLPYNYNTYIPVSVPFAGVAKSVIFGGVQNYIVFDDVTFGSLTPGGGDPPPPVPVSNWALYLGILLMITFVVIRFRRMI